MIGTLRKSLKVLAIVAFVGLATVSVGAQAQDLPPLSAARSQALQNQLKAIDQDRAGFLEQLLAQWAPYVDGNTHDLQANLEQIANKVPAWQLYGASLAGDFPTMLRILTGAEGAGRYVSAYEEPQPKMALASSSGFADILGSTSDYLVYTPISPCRVVDTRGSGARTGILAAGSARTFDLTSDAFGKGQGGATSCAGLPSFSYRGWAVNITVTGHTGSGWIVAWPSGGVEPTASVLNYGTALYAIASGQTLTGCTGCADDIVIRAANASAHVIIDVVGYYRDAGITTAAVSRVVGDVEPVAGNNSLFIDGGLCPAGTLLIGGDVDHSENDVAVAKTTQISATQWRFWMKNNTASPVTVTGYSRCMDAPIVIF